MSTRVDVEEIEITRGEKLLAVVLAAFLLVGALWAYFELNLADDQNLYRDPVAQLSASQRAILDRAEVAADRARTARARVSDRRQALVDAREAYRTALDEGQRDPELERRYRRAQTRHEDARREARQRSVEAREAEAAATPVLEELARLEDEAVREAEDESRSDDLVTAGLRLLLVLGLLGAALSLMARQRRRRSRWAMTGYAAVGASAVLGLVMGVDYVTDWFIVVLAPTPSPEVLPPCRKDR